MSAPKGVTTRGLALVMVAIVSVQFGAAVAKHVITIAGPVGTVFYRSAFAALILGVVARPSWRDRSREDWLLVAAFGVGLAAMNVAYYAALERLPIGITVTLEFAGPLAVTVIASRRRIDVVWAALAAAGLVLLSPLSGAHLDALGVALALVAGACWAAYILLGARVGARFEGLDGLALALCVSTALTAAPAVATAGSTLLDPEVIGVALLVAVMSSAIPYACELEALRCLSVSSFGMLLSLEPAVGALAGAVVLGEHLGARELGAVVLVLVANAGAVATRRPRGAASPTGTVAP